MWSPALRPLILAFATLAIIAGSFGSVAQAGDPRVDFEAVFKRDAIEKAFDGGKIESRAIEDAIAKAPALRKAIVYSAPFPCGPCDNQKAAFAGVEKVASVEWVVGKDPPWLTGYPTVYLPDVNLYLDRESSPGYFGPLGVTVDGLAKALKNNPLKGQAVGLGAITVGEIPAKDLVAKAIGLSASVTGQPSGTVRIDFEGQGPQALQLGPGVEIRVRDPLTVRYRWSESKIEATFEPSTSIALKAGSVHSGINGISADVGKIVVDLPGWITPDLKVNLR